MAKLYDTTLLCRVNRGTSFTHKSDKVSVVQLRRYPEIARALLYWELNFNNWGKYENDFDVIHPQELRIDLDDA